MNLWIVNHYTGTPDLFLHTRTFDLSRELVKRGHKVTILASSFNHFSFCEEHLNKGENFKVEIRDGVKFIWLRTMAYSNNNWKRYLGTLEFSCRALFMGIKLREHPDIIIGACVHQFATLAAYILARFKKARYFYEVNDLWPQTLVEMGVLKDKSLITWMLRKLEKFLMKRAVKVIAVLPHIDDYLQEIGLPREKFVWISNGIHPWRYDKVTPYDGAPDGRLKLFFLGTFPLAGKLEILLQAAKILQDQNFDQVRFILVGDGRAKPNLMKMSDEMGLKNIEFRDTVPKNELYKPLSEADGFLAVSRNFPLHRYGISYNKIYDYFMGARPIIFSVNSKNRPVKDADAGLEAPVENPPALAETIKKFIALTPQERIRMGQNGREYAMKNHTFTHLADKLEAALLGS